MDPVQDEHERWVGQQVIDWYNSRHGTNLVFHQRCDDAPDLEYRDGSKLLRLEVATAYYDTQDARFIWLRARKRLEAPAKWIGVNFDRSLVANINSELVDKCGKSYGSHCSLAVGIQADLTDVKDFESYLMQISIPSRNPFEGIYLCGRFPALIGMPAEIRVWQLA